MVVPVTFVAGEDASGEEKKDVIELFAFGFLASERGRVEALRLSDIVSVR